MKVITTGSIIIVQSEFLPGRQLSLSDSQVKEFHEDLAKLEDINRDRAQDGVLFVLKWGPYVTPN